MIIIWIEWFVFVSVEFNSEEFIGGVVVGGGVCEVEIFVGIFCWSFGNIWWDYECYFFVGENRFFVGGVEVVNVDYEVCIEGGDMWWCCFLECEGGVEENMVGLCWEGEVFGGVGGDLEGVVVDGGERLDGEGGVVGLIEGEFEFVGGDFGGGGCY